MKKPIIGIDARSISDRICGVSRVTTCLIEALSQVDNENYFIIYADAVSPFVSLNKNFVVKRTYCPRKNPIYDIQFYSILKSDSLDLFHSMHSWLPKFIPKRVKKVVTIHDLFAMTDPEFFIKFWPFHKLFQLYFRRLTTRAAKRSDAIITVSNYCKREISKYFPFAEDKTHVVYNAHGIDRNCIKMDTYERPVEDEYFLYVGNCRSYKNVETLIDGFSVFLKRSKRQRIKLIIAGNDPCKLIKAKVCKMGIDANVIFLSNLSDDNISNLYQGAVCFIFPSKEEGFGIPVVEAMSMATPVIISDADALVEVAGDAALVFRRGNAQELAILMERIYSDPILRNGLIQKGLKRASIFSWQSSAIQLKKIYERLLNKERE